MSGDGKALEKLARRTLSGEGAHVGTRDVFSGLDWRSAGSRPRGVPHSAYQLLKHMCYWQDWVVAWLDGQEPALPRRASGSWRAKAGALLRQLLGKWPPPSGGLTW